jgi:hypothetical protein
MLRTPSSNFCSRCGRINTVGWTSTAQTSAFSAIPSSHRWASTRQVTQQPVDDAVLPRFLRRKLLQKTSGNTSSSKSVHNENGIGASVSKAKPVYRSKHYDPSRETTPKSEMRLLEPHVLSARLKKLSDSGKLGDAETMLKNAPLDAQNTPVWNTIIWGALKCQRYNLAFQFYIDVRVTCLSLFFAVRHTSIS